MTTHPLDPPARRPLIRRLPILGPIARELAEGDTDYPLYLVAAALALWGCAFMIWGLPALVLPAVVASVLVLVLLVLVTRG